MRYFRETAFPKRLPTDIFQVLSKWFGMDMVRDNTQNCIPLGPDLFQSIWVELKCIKKSREKIRFFEDFLRLKLLKQPYEKDEIDLAYKSILARAGKTPIKEIISGIGMHPRTFRSKFVKRVSISAKALARIVRVSFLWDQVISGKATDYQDMVFEGDYFDQAHFIKDFKMIVGESPKLFFKRNHEGARLMSGKCIKP